MANFNKVILAGNLTRDPELRYTPKGLCIAAFALAINRKWSNEAGEQKEEVTFVEIVAFGRTGETIGQYLKKGRPMLVEGRLKLDQWDDKQTGQKRQKLSVVCESFQFLDSGNREGGERGGYERRESSERRAPAAQRSEPEGEEDIPPHDGDNVPF